MSYPQPQSTKGTRMPADKIKTSDDVTKVWQMMKSIDTCMFVTLPEGRPQGRPMSTIPMQDEGTIFMLTEATSAGAKDVGSNANVLLAYQGGSEHVSVAGTASIDTDMALIKRLWSPGAQAFWPDGPEAANVVAIRVQPNRADYWDGPNPLTAAAKFVFGLVTKQEPDLGERGTVTL
jgi:general stress protein 26